MILTVICGYLKCQSSCQVLNNLFIGSEVWRVAVSVEVPNFLPVLIDDRKVTGHDEAVRAIEGN